MNMKVSTDPPVNFEVRVPNVLSDFIQEQTRAGGFNSEGDYLLDLVERDRARVAREEFEIEILKGVNSGPGVTSSREFWRQKREELEKRLQGPESAK